MQKLLEVLHDALPKMSLIASDFSFLPDVKVPGERAPLVSTKVSSFHTSENIRLYVYSTCIAGFGFLIKLSYKFVIFKLEKKKKNY